MWAPKLLRLGVRLAPKKMHLIFTPVIDVLYILPKFYLGTCI